MNSEGFKETAIGLIPENWKLNAVKDITNKVCVGFVGTCLKYYCGDSEGIPMIRTTNLTNNKISYDNLKYVLPEFHKKNIKSQLKKGDLVIARHGNNGQICSFEEDIEANCLNIVIVKPDNDKAYHKYLLYAFKSPIIRHQIEASIVGSVQGVLNTKTIEKLEIPCPILMEQYKIAEILDKLNQKIELNQKMNQNLEAIGQSLFKHWFVNFEFPDENNNPYKSSGGEMFDSEIGQIPVKWDVQELGNIIETIGGGTPSTKKEEYWENGDIQWFSPSDITGNNQMFISNSDKKINRHGLKSSSAKLLPPKSLMLTSRATVGELSINIHEACTNQGFINCIPNDRLSLQYLYFWIKMNKKNIIGLASGSTFREINKSTFRALKIIIPNQKKLSKYNLILAPIFNEIEILQIQNEKLSQIRDSLLPKLISGRIRVNILEEASAK